MATNGQHAELADEGLAHALEALSDVYGHLSQVVQAMPGALIVLQGDGTIVEVNPAAGQLLETNPEQLLWNSVEPYLGEKHPPVGQLFAQLRRAEREEPGRGTRFESCWKTSEGRPIRVLFSARLLATSPTHLVCVLLDITEQKRLEIDLIHTQKLEAVGQLATGIVQEISAPVQYLNDRIHTIERTLAHIVGPNMAPSPITRLLHEMLEDIADTKKGLQRVDEIIHATRAFSYPERRKKAPTDLRGIIESTLLVTRNEYENVADMVIGVDMVPPVYCCAGDIRQVVLTLIVNAVQSVRKAHPDGRLGTIRLGLETTPDGYVTLSVADDGVGIPQEFHQRIFEPFFFTKDSSLGTEGLSIASHLVEENDGRIWVRSQPNFGATFYVSLPLASTRTL